MCAHIYEEKFYEYAAKTSAHTADVVTSYLFPLLSPDSILDVGCASGTWLKHWKQKGAVRIHGLDGHSVSKERLQIPVENYQTIDLNSCLDLDQKYDVVQSLEVAEHLNPSSSEKFIDFLTNHSSKFVIFSAAPVGQGGESHINERSYEYWRHLFRARGFSIVDAIRPIIINDRDVSYWYKYNMFLYVRNEILSSLDERLMQFYLDNDTKIKDISPLSFRIRKEIIARLPMSVQGEIARIKSKFIPTGKF